MAQSDYTYETGMYEGKPYIAITDQNLGRKAVTNDIKNVVAEICEKEGISAEDQMVVYADSNGNWDAYSTVSEKFTVFTADSAEEALGYYVQYLKKDD